MRKKLLSRVLNSDKGSQAIEFIAVLPLFTIVIIMIMQSALLAITAVKAHSAAVEGARAAAVAENDRKSEAREAVNQAVVTEDIINFSMTTGVDSVTVEVELNTPMVIDLLDEEVFEKGLSVGGSATMKKEE